MLLICELRIHVFYYNCLLHDDLSTWCEHVNKLKMAITTDHMARGKEESDERESF